MGTLTTLLCGCECAALGSRAGLCRTTDEPKRGGAEIPRQRRHALAKGSDGGEPDGAVGSRSSQRYRVAARQFCRTVAAGDDRPLVRGFERHAIDGDAVHQAALALIVVERIVPGRAVVPERDGALLPAKARLEFRPRCMLAEILEQRLALLCGRCGSKLLARGND